MLADFPDGQDQLGNGHFGTTSAEDRESSVTSLFPDRGERSCLSHSVTSSVTTNYLVLLH
jgi:hypothetical protein